MKTNDSFDDDIDDSGLIISVTQRNTEDVSIISYNWPTLFLLSFSIIGIVGNLLVCIAIGTERRLHNRTNWFLFSLALADMLVSGVVIPLAVVKEFTGLWILGPIVCDLWIFLDVCSCTSSIMHIVVISIDRYLAIKDPLNVRSRQKKRQIYLLIILIWLIAILLSSPIIILGVINPYNIIINGQCFINNQFFVIYGSVVSFVIPLIIVIVTYVLTVHGLKKQIRQFQSQPEQQQTTETTKKNLDQPFLRRQIGNSNMMKTFSPSAPTLATRFKRKRLQRQPISFDISEESLSNPCSGQQRNRSSINEYELKTISNRSSVHSEYACPKNPFYQLKCTCDHDQRLNSIDEHEQIDSTCLPCYQKTTSTVNMRSSLKSRRRPVSLPASILLTESTSTVARPVRHLWRRLTLIPNLSSTRTKCSAVRNEQKAVKVLGVVFAIFVIAWFPFCIMNLLQGVCKRCSINPNILNGFVWLGYVSSTINPLVYTTFNRNFRTKFLDLLKCRCLFESDRQRQLSYYKSYSYIHGPRIQHVDGLVANDIRRFNERRHRMNTTVY